MNKKIAFLLIIFTISSFMCFSNDNSFKLNNFNMSFSNSYSFKNQVTRYSHSNNYGKVASDREEIESETFHLFRCFRDASIGMFVPGGLLGSGCIIATAVLYFVYPTVKGISDATLLGITSVADFINVFGEVMPGFYAILGIGIFSSVFLLCGIAFAAAAGGLYYKWAKNRELTAFNSLSIDSPSFKQGFSIAL